MFVGAYWSVRRESREEVARRLTRLLSSFANAEPTLSEWFLKGRTKASARTALEIDVAAIASKLKVNRRDVGGEVISELGFSLGLWNGRNASLAVTMGAYSQHIRNSAVLSFMDAPAHFDSMDWKRLLDAFVRELDPDQAVVTTSDFLAQRGAANPWEAGWFTYFRGGSTQEHSFK